MRQIIPIVAPGGGGTSGALAEMAAVCVAEAVGPHDVASAFDEPVVVVADDEICYRLGPVLFETTSIGSFVAEGDADLAARRMTIQLSADDAERFSQLTGQAAAATADVPTGRLAFLLGGTLLHVSPIHDSVHDGMFTLQAGGRSFDDATVAMFETMTEAP